MSQGVMYVKLVISPAVEKSCRKQMLGRRKTAQGQNIVHMAGGELANVGNCDTKRKVKYTRK